MLFDVLDEHETRQLALRLSMCLVAPLILGFQGNLGAGKTTLIRAMLRGLHVEENIKSPTFSLVESYDLPNQSTWFHHFDLYRIDDDTELDYIGFRDYFSKQAICCVEWPERSQDLMSKLDVRVSLMAVNETSRQLTLSALTPAGEAFLSCLEAACVTK